MALRCKTCGATILVQVWEKSADGTTIENPLPWEWWDAHAHGGCRKIDQGMRTDS